MRAAVMYGAGDVRVETVPHPTIQEPTDAIVRIVAGPICGSDLWPYASKPESAEGARMGHEFVGVVEELGSEVTGLARGPRAGRGRHRRGQGPHGRRQNARGPRSSGPQTGARHGDWRGARRRRHQPCGCAPVLRRSARIPRVPAEHHPHRRRCTGPRIYRELLPLVLDGTIEPGKVFDRTIGLDGVPAGYQAMASREALKVLVRP
jgi:Alcohol dehydrogenase GroES-like domain